MRPAVLDVGARQAVQAATPAATAKDVKIKVSLPSRRRRPRRSDRLRQIAWHLLANAIKFTPRDGILELAVESFGRRAASCVTRPGIAPAFLPRIFDRFSQADSSPTRAAGGLGVGLALVRELIERCTAGKSRPQTGRWRRRDLHSPPSAAPRDRRRGRRRCAQPPLPTAISRRPAGPAARPGPGWARTAADCAGATRRFRADRRLGRRGARVPRVWRPDVLVSDSVSPEHDYYALGQGALARNRSRRPYPRARTDSVSQTDERLRRLLADVSAICRSRSSRPSSRAEIARLAGRERRRAQR